MFSCKAGSASSECKGIGTLEILPKRLPFLGGWFEDSSVSCELCASVFCLIQLCVSIFPHFPLPLVPPFFSSYSLLKHQRWKERMPLNTLPVRAVVICDSLPCRICFLSLQMATNSELCKLVTLRVAADNLRSPWAVSAWELSLSQGPCLEGHSRASSARTRTWK